MVTRIGDDVPERQIFRDDFGLFALGGDNGFNYTVSDLNGFSLELLFRRSSSKDTNTPEAKMNNGLSNEILISILIDRIKILDSKCPCDHNKVAINNLQSALYALIARSHSTDLLDLNKR